LPQQEQEKEEQDYPYVWSVPDLIKKCSSKRPEKIIINILLYILLS